MIWTLRFVILNESPAHRSQCSWPPSIRQQTSCKNKWVHELYKLDLHSTQLRKACKNHNGSMPCKIDSNDNLIWKLRRESVELPFGHDLAASIVLCVQFDQQRLQLLCLPGGWAWCGVFCKCFQSCIGIQVIIKGLMNIDEYVFWAFASQRSVRILRGCLGWDICTCHFWRWSSRETSEISFASAKWKSWCWKKQGL